MAASMSNNSRDSFNKNRLLSASKLTTKNLIDVMTEYHDRHLGHILEDTIISIIQQQHAQRILDYHSLYNFCINHKIHSLNRALIKYIKDLKTSYPKKQEQQEQEEEKNQDQNDKKEKEKEKQRQEQIINDLIKNDHKLTQYGRTQNVDLLLMVTMNDVLGDYEIKLMHKHIAINYRYGLNGAIQNNKKAWEHYSKINFNYDKILIKDLISWGESDPDTSKDPILLGKLSLLKQRLQQIIENETKDSLINTATKYSSTSDFIKDYYYSSNNFVKDYYDNKKNINNENNKDLSNENNNTSNNNNNNNNNKKDQIKLKEINEVIENLENVNKLFIEYEVFILNIVDPAYNTIILAEKIFEDLHKRFPSDLFIFELYHMSKKFHFKVNEVRSQFQFKYIQLLSHMLPIYKQRLTSNFSSNNIELSLPPSSSSLTELVKFASLKSILSMFKNDQNSKNYLSNFEVDELKKLNELLTIWIDMDCYDHTSFLKFREYLSESDTLYKIIMILAFYHDDNLLDYKSNLENDDNNQSDYDFTVFENIFPVPNPTASYHRRSATTINKELISVLKMKKYIIQHLNKDDNGSNNNDDFAIKCLNFCSKLLWHRKKLRNSEEKVIDIEYLLIRAQINNKIKKDNNKDININIISLIEPLEKFCFSNKFLFANNSKNPKFTSLVLEYAFNLLIDQWRLQDISQFKSILLKVEIFHKIVKSNNIIISSDINDMIVFLSSSL
jgi:hypothetical protein